MNAAQHGYSEITVGGWCLTLIRIGRQARRIALTFMMLASFESAAKGQSTAAQQKTPAAPLAATRSLQELADASHPGLRVDYRDGHLTIDAQNASLGEVLRLIAEKTGASIDIPPGSGAERIVEHAGPGPMKSVLEHLLNGSSFNFVIIKSPLSSDPQRILLTLQRTSSPQIAPQPVQASRQSVLWTPPDTTEKPIPLSAEMDETLVVPKEAMSPEAMSEFMRQKERELREKALQQYPQ